MKNSISNSIGSSNVNAGNNNGKNSFGMTASNVIEEQSEMNENVMDAIAKKIKNSKQKSNTGVMNSTNPVTNTNQNLIQNLMIGKFNSLYPKSVEKDAKVNSNSLYSISNANVSGQSATKLNLTK